MKKYTKKHFLFDLDDTLTDSYEFNQQMFVDTFSQYLDLTNKQTEKYLRELHYNSKGTQMVSQFSEAIKHFSLKLDAKELVILNEQLHIEKIEKIKVFDAVHDYIKYLNKAKKQVSVISNRQSVSLNKVLKVNKIDKYFTHVISCSDEGHEKPDPHCLIQLIKQSNLRNSDFIYFGDSKTDYEFATAADADCVIVDHYINQKKFYKMILSSFV